MENEVKVNEVKIIDINKRRTYKKYKKWFELYAKFLSLFNKKKRKDKNVLKYYK